MLITVKLNACYGVKISKNTPIKISNRGARARRAGAGSAFDSPLEANKPCESIETI